MNTPHVRILVLVLVMTAALAACQTHPGRYGAVKRNLKESYQNGDITRDEYNEALDRYRQSSKGGAVQTPDNDVPF